MGSIKKMSNTIPIVFATDDNFVMHCFIAVFSLIDHMSDELQYNIYILYTHLSENNIKLLESLTKKNVMVKCLDITRHIAKYDLEKRRRLPVTTYYRLFISMILPQFEKVIYLDSDICVLSDISELYNENMEDYALAAVLDTPVYNVKAHTADLGGMDYRYTFNAGVLLINISMFEKEKIRDRCIILLKKDNAKKKRRLTWADQDALNLVLHKKIHILDNCWNCQVQFLAKPQVVIDGFYDEYNEIVNKAKIYHFSGERLWLRPNYKPAKVYWGYAARTPFFNSFLIQLLERAKMEAFEHVKFPYDKIPYNSKIILYGAGKIGKAFHQQLLLTKYSQVVLWVDGGWKAIDPKVGVSSPECIVLKEYDFILIAVDKERIKNEIKENLIHLGIEEKRIVWQDYGNE